MTTTTRTPMTLQQKQQRALDRARCHGGAHAATNLGHGLYHVTGRNGQVYGLVVEGDTIRCECEAGLAGQPCWHAAAVWTRRLAEQMTLTEYRPAPADTPEARRAFRDAFVALLEGR